MSLCAVAIQEKSVELDGAVSGGSRGLNRFGS